MLLEEAKVEAKTDKKEMKALSKYKVDVQCIVGFGMGVFIVLTENNEYWKVNYTEKEGVLKSKWMLIWLICWLFHTI